MNSDVWPRKQFSDYRPSPVGCQTGIPSPPNAGDLLPTEFGSRSSPLSVQTRDLDPRISTYDRPTASMYRHPDGRIEPQPYDRGVSNVQMDRSVGQTGSSVSSSSGIDANESGNPRVTDLLVCTTSAFFSFAT